MSTRGRQTSRGRLPGLLLALALVLPLTPASADQPAAKVPILFDTDIGTGIDDVFALGLILASPGVELRGVTTVGSAAEDRAWIVCRFLTHAGRGKIPVAWGRDKQPDEPIDWQIQYRRHPAVVWNRTAKPSKQPAVELMYDVLKADPGKVTIVACGPLTNVAALLKAHPDAKQWIKRIIFVIGERSGAKEQHNVGLDAAPFQSLIDAGAPLTIVPMEDMPPLPIEAIFAARTAVSYQMQSLYELWDQKGGPTIGAALAVALAEDEGIATMKEVTLYSGGVEVGGKIVAREPSRVDGERFSKMYVDRLTKFGGRIQFKEPGNASKLVERGPMPNRVHAFENFDTDIEKRWWMTGKLETADVAPGRGRACRAVLTQDYDDRMGDAAAVYRAVIFNPVPGPPMGRNTRLAFRYKLHGTSTIRVQLFSLSNGYHRYLSVKDLPQDQWREATVDMTEMRRPDGSGGPLAEDERIDDIQFYVDPRAELLIDDIVLYDASSPKETQTFPNRFQFTGWFDTGKQEQEWPGEFEIVKHDPPLTWKGARPVNGHIRLGLRGPRPVGKSVELRFRYRMDQLGDVTMTLRDSKSGREAKANLKEAPAGTWAVATVRFAPPAGMIVADEVEFRSDKGFILDDVLLYEPGDR